MDKRRKTTPLDMAAITKKIRHKQRIVAVLCDVIAETMQELHGRSFRVQIDHARGFVFVTENATDMPIPRPAQGFVV